LGTPEQRSVNAAKIAPPRGATADNSETLRNLEQSESERPPEERWTDATEAMLGIGELKVRAEDSRRSRRQPVVDGGVLGKSGRREDQDASS